MQNKTLASKTAKNSVWSVADILFRQGISFVLGIILARLLTPSDYGTIGLMMIFITIANVFVDSGFSSGLIRKIDRTNEDLNTAFYFNVFIGILMYLILFTAAPFVSLFFKNPELTQLLRVLGLVLVLNSFSMVQNAILIYSMKVRQLAVSSAVSQVSTGIVAIILAYNHFGVWALVVQQLASSVLQIIFLFSLTKWRPSLIFSKNSFNYLWSFGSKLLTATLIGTIFNQAYSFIIGKTFGKRELGLYTRADQFAVQPSGIISNVINKALVPSLAECQRNLDELKLNYVKCTEIIAFLIFPLMFTLSFSASPLFEVLFGKKWIDAVPLFEILCFSYAFDVFSTFSLQLIQILGRTDYTLKLELFKKPFYTIIIFCTVWGGLKWIVLGHAFYRLIAALINLSVVKNLLKYSYIQQVTDIFKYALLAICVIFPICFCFKSIGMHLYLQLLLCIFPSFISYGFIAFLLKVRGLKYVLALVYKIK